MSTKEISIEMAKEAIIKLVPDQKTKRDELVELALKQVGITEFPANSNKIIYNTWFYGHEVYDGDHPGSHYPWCCTFICWLFSKINKPMPKADYFHGWSSVPNIYKYAVKNGMITNDPKKGDLVIYFWSGEIRHIGIFLENTESKILTVEGNTSFDGTGSQDNGGCCALKHQNKNIVHAYVNIDLFLK